MRNWSEIRAWRNTTRKKLIAKRVNISPDKRTKSQDIVSELIRTRFADLHEACISFYWPINAEIDLRPLLQELLEAGADAALPAVVAKHQPLEFWAWQADMKMAHDMANIPVPEMRKPAAPNVMLIPLLGFDEDGHRLGHGGGYYDRTLAAFRLTPFTIGIGYEFGRLKTIYPRAHDIPLDAIVTESGVRQFDRNEPRAVASSSSPCYQHEFDHDGDLP